MSDDRIDVHVEPGGEHLVKWAKQRLSRLRELREDLNLPVMTKHFKLPESLISVKTSEWGDRIRITFATGTVSLLINAALAALEVPVELLDAGEEDFGLVLPKDVPKLPGSFKKGTLDATRTPPYRGMIANHAFRAQHPADYGSVEEWLSPSGLNLAPHAFRYFPDLNGGTFLIGSAHFGGDPGFEDTAWTLTWVSGANANAGANLTITKSKVQPYPGDVDLYLYPNEFTMGTDGVCGVAENQVILSGSFPTVMTLRAYKPDGTTESLITKTGDEGLAISGRDGTNHYLALSYKTSATTSQLELLSQTGTVLSEEIVVASGTGVFAAGVRVKAPAVEGETTKYIIPYSTSDAINVVSFWARSHLGTVQLLAGDTFNNGLGYSSEHHMDFNPVDGKPALAITGLVAAQNALFIHVWGGPVHFIPSDGAITCRWTPDGRYFLAMSSVLRVLNTSGEILGTGSSVEATTGMEVFGSSSVDPSTGVITGNYTILSLGTTIVQEYSFTTTEVPGVSFEITGVTNTQLGAGLAADDTRRSYS